MLNTALSLMISSLVMSPAGTIQPTLTAGDLAFMVGTWRGEEGPMVIEETWLPPLGGNLTGVFRLTNPNDNGELEVSVVEIMTITEAQDSNDLVYRLRHFDTALVPWASELEGGPIEARVVLAGERSLRFDPVNMGGSIESFEYVVVGETLTATVNFREEGREPFVLRFERVD